MHRFPRKLVPPIISSRWLSLEGLVVVEVIISFTNKWLRSGGWMCHSLGRYQFTVIRDVDSFPKILEENLSKPSLSVIFTGDIDPATGKSW